jgi:hypothetical protein
MIEGEYTGQKNHSPIALACARAIQPLLDHLGQQQQLSILAAVESVVSELMGFSATIENQKPDGYYTQPARGKQELLQNPDLRKEVEKFVKDHGGTKSDLPW